MNYDKLWNILLENGVIELINNDIDYECSHYDETTFNCLLDEMDENQYCPNNCRYRELRE